MPSSAFSAKLARRDLRRSRRRRRRPTRQGAVRRMSLTVAGGDRVALVGDQRLGQVDADADPRWRPAARRGRGAVRPRGAHRDPRSGSPAAAGDRRRPLGDSWEVAAVATSLGVQPLLERRTDELSGGQAKRVALDTSTGRGVRSDPARRAHQPPRPGSDRVARDSDWPTPVRRWCVITHDRHLMDRLTTGEATAAWSSSRWHRLRAPCLRRRSAYAAYLEGRCRAPRAGRRRGVDTTNPGPRASWRGCGRRTGTVDQAKGAVAIGAARSSPDGPSRPGCAATICCSTSGRPASATRWSNCSSVCQSYGSNRVLRGVDLLIEPGARLGVVGPNGSGKSTLLDIVAGRRATGHGRW